MRRGQKRILAGLAGLILGAVSLAVYLLLRPISVKTIIIPTLAVLPSVTPSATPPLTLTPSSTPTFTATLTPSATETPLPSPTLATRVLVITAVMPGVQPTTLSEALLVTVLPALPEPLDPLPDATQGAPPFWGWYSFELDHPVISYGGAEWLPVLAAEASRGQYHRTEDMRGYARFPFDGIGLRVRYVAARNMGMFTLIVDGQVLDTIDAYAPERTFPTTRIYTLPSGSHLLQIQPTGRKNPQSEGYVVGLDAIQVYRNDQVQIAAAFEFTHCIAPPPNRAGSADRRAAHITANTFADPTK